jgi:hypothetical protein
MGTIVQTIPDVLYAIMGRYPDRIYEAQKCLEGFHRYGWTEIVQKRLSILFGNLPRAQSTEELEERREWAQIIYGEELESRSKRLVIRVTPEELAVLHEKAKEQMMTLSDWARVKLGLKLDGKDEE